MEVSVATGHNVNKVFFDVARTSIEADISKLV